MKAHMKEHSVEYAGDASVETEEEAAEAETNAERAPTEAAAYAAQQRKERQERDFWSIQGGVDSVVSGAKLIGSGVKAVLDAVADIVSDTPLSKQTILAALIGVLVLSNVYTYFAFKSTKEGIKARRAGRLGYGNEMEDAVRAILRQQQESARSPAEEARELQRVLGDIEVRFQRLQAGLKETLRREDGRFEDVD